MSVYFFQGGPDMRDPIKIGWARSTVNRFASLQAGCPRGLHYVASFGGERAQETRLHSMFSQYRFRNEWFFASTALIGFIIRCVASGTLDVPDYPTAIERAQDHPRVNYGGYGIAMPIAAWIEAERAAG